MGEYKEGVSNELCYWFESRDPGTEKLQSKYILYIVRRPTKMKVMENEKTCKFCNKALIGRADKKFCDSECRSSYYNALNRNANNFMRKINRTLSKNRRILKKTESRWKSYYPQKPAY